jgi:hypothetical protein
LIKNEGNSPERLDDIASIYRARSEPQYVWAADLTDSVNSKTGGTLFNSIIEIHNPSIRMIAGGMMGFIENKKAYIFTKVYIRMTKCV